MGKGDRHGQKTLIGAHVFLLGKHAHGYGRNKKGEGHG